MINLGYAALALDPLAEARAGRVPIVVIDAMDEARLRVTGVSWDEFMNSLSEYATGGVHLVILGRKRTIEDVWYAISDQLTVSWYEISHFDRSMQSQYVDFRAQLAPVSTPVEAYEKAKLVVLQQLNGANDSALDESFAGYAPRTRRCLGTSTDRRKLSGCAERL